MRQLATIVLAALAAVTFGVMGAPAHAAARSAPGPSWDATGAWTPTFSDGFSGTTLDSKWSGTWWNSHGGSGGMVQPGNPFMTACYDASQDTVSGGYLHLKLSHKTVNCGQTRAWDGAVADTFGTFQNRGFQQQGGAFEARIYLPCVNGQVIGWPSFWQNNFQFSGEIDTMEAGAIASGMTGGTAVNMHYTDPGGAHQDPGHASASPLCGWHRFGSQWDVANQTDTVYWDGQQFYTHQFVGPLPTYLILDYQQFANGIAPPNGSATMRVDWVRAWVPAAHTTAHVTKRGTCECVHWVAYAWGSKSEWTDNPEGFYENAWAFCRDNKTGATTNIFGKWRTASFNYSNAPCPGGYVMAKGGYQTKESPHGHVTRHQEYPS